MEKLTNIKHKIDLSLSSNAQPTQNKIKTKKCNECNKIIHTRDENYQICRMCYETKKIIIPSGK